LRVGFVFRGGEGWLGGVNYLWNLLYAVGQHEREIEPVLIAPPDAKLFGLDQLPGVEVVRDAPREETRLDQVARTFERRVRGHDQRVLASCERHRIDVLSHSGTFGWRFPVPTVPWLADFQHRRLSQFFSLGERAQRIYSDVSQLIEGRLTILSSKAAQADCERYYGPLTRQTRVVHFVSQPRLERSKLPTTQALRERHALPERYFFLPNQFWRHKNHAVVVDALVSLARRGILPHVVLTGKGEDYRAPAHYASLMKRVAEQGLASRFLHLGMVPYEDLMALMRDCVAVINPSYFEGWSTTVEEARSLGKSTLLSDIDVHREQAPPGATFFDPDDVEALAHAMESAWARDAEHEDRERASRADADLVPRTAAFAARYREIISLVNALRPRAP
jgi:glycosyltransferase involved in cell wall biosynthesis